MKITSTEKLGQNSLKMLVYGFPGAGKTFLCGTTNEPTLMISAESGLLSLAGKKIDVIDIGLDDNDKPIHKGAKLVRLRKVYDYLLTDEAKKKYKWVCIDSLTEIMQVLMQQLDEEFPSRADSFPKWGQYLERGKTLIKLFRDIPHFNVVFTALATVDKDANNRRIFGVDISGKLGDQIPAYFDQVFYLQALPNEEGKLVRVLRTQPSAEYICKDRSGKLSASEAPNLSAIAKKIAGIKPEVAAVVAAISTTVQNKEETK